MSPTRAWQSKHTIGYLERGEYSPSFYLALRIAEYFEVPTDVVYSIRESPRIS